MRESYLYYLRVEQERLSYFVNCLCNINAARARFYTIVNRATGIDPAALAENVQPFVGAFVARIENKAMCLHNGSGSDILAVCPKGGTRGGASGAQDTFRRIVKSFALGNGLQPFAFGRRFVVDEKRFHR